MTYEKLIEAGNTGVVYLTPADSDFEVSYLNLRSREQRLHDDEMVRKLPHLPATHPLHREWKQRANTLRRFRRFLQRGPRRRILEIGCGNGWFSAQIAPLSSHTVGLDVGTTELDQAFRCFSSDHVSFICSTDLELLPTESFDLIVFNASIQYFELNPSFWQQLYALLLPHGEIHLIDSPIYTQKEVAAAQERSRAYYFTKLDMDIPTYYHHPTWNQLPAGYQILFRPGIVEKKLLKNATPFPWIRVYNPL